MKLTHKRLGVLLGKGRTKKPLFTEKGGVIIDVTAILERGHHLVDRAHSLIDRWNDVKKAGGRVNFSAKDRVLSQDGGGQLRVICRTIDDYCVTKSGLFQDRSDSALCLYTWLPRLLRVPSMSVCRFYSEGP